MGRRWGLAAALLAAASPLSAQDAPIEIPATAPPAAEAIGPRELSNFSLDGTVTRPADQQSAAQPPAPAVAEPSPPTASPADSGAVQPAPVRLASSQADRQPASDRPAINPLSQPPTLSRPTSVTPAAPAFSGLTDSSSVPIEADYGFSPLPWIAALLLLGAGAVIYFGRQRRGDRYAAAGHAPFQDYASEPQPVARPAPRPQQPERKPPPTLLRQPAPPPASPRPDLQPAPSGAVTTRLRPTATPAPQPDAPLGIVATSLRPWIDLEFTPIQALLNNEDAAILFEVTLFNSGSAPARDVAVDARLLNVGKNQEQLLADFFTEPAASRDTIPLIAPFARVPLKSVVRLPRSAVRQYQVEGRKLFMPMVGISARYRWSSGDGQTGAAFLVGKDPGDPAAKLAPLRADQGARGWKKLGTRPYERGIRR